MSRVLLTGGAGFIGGVVARRLRERGDAVVAIVRDPARAGSLSLLGVKLVAGDLSSVEAIASAADGVGAVIHAAGSYRIGILPEERPAMLDANEGTAMRVLEAAVRAGVGRTVVVSTVGVFGDTRGRVVDETFQRDLSTGFLSYYDESKWRAHVAMLRAIEAGQPVVIVQPGQVYGLEDQSSAGGQLRAAAAGHLPYRAFDSLGLCMGHVEDVAAGVVAAFDHGRLGEAYVLAGPNHRFRELIAQAAAVGGVRGPRLEMPAGVARLLSHLGPRVARLGGAPLNLAEVVRASDGVTYWATSAKAERELGFHARSIAEGFAQVYGRS